MQIAVSKPTSSCVLARRLAEVGRYARDHGLKLSLHHGFEQPVMYPEDVEIFFGAIQDGSVGLTFDTGVFAKSGVPDSAPLVRDYRSIIDNFHLKDYSDGEFRVLGEGELEFGPLFDAIREIGYDGWISADEESRGDVLKGMAACFDFMSKGLRLKARKT